MRAIGPELTPYGVPNVLEDPTLELHDGTGDLIASNDDWETTIIGGIITADQVPAILLSGKRRRIPLSLRSLQLATGSLHRDRAWF